MTEELKALVGSVVEEIPIMSNPSFIDAFDAELIQKHIDSGQPRYCVRLDLQNGGFIRRWSDERDAALDLHRQGLADPRMKAVFCYDHIGLDMIAVDFAQDGRSYEQITADADAAIDRMIDRWAAEQGG